MGKSGDQNGGRPVVAEDLRMELRMREQLGELLVPTLQHRNNPREHLFFAFLDGTGQDLNNPRLGPPTTVGMLFRQAERLANEPDSRIGAHYSQGIGTQRNAVGRAIDGMVAHSWDDGIEKAYKRLSSQTEEWKQRDPEADVRVVGMGYSRGGVQTPGLLRLIDQYGIADPRGLEFGRDAHGNITVESKLPPLVAPGQVAQAALLFDPVATNMPHNYDARLPASVISSVSILAFHEQRELFPHQTINAPGISRDGRAINIAAPGGHSNVGGGNREAGLETLTANAAIDYLNRLTDQPLFEKHPIPNDLAGMTVFQAQGATAAWGLRMDHDGVRDLRAELANCKIVDPCRDSEPVDQSLAARFDHRRIQFDPAEQARLEALVQLAQARDLSLAPDAPSSVLTPDSPDHPKHGALLRIREGVQAAEGRGQVSFATDQQREQFSRSALASMADNRDINRVDDVIIGTKGYAFLIQNGSTPYDQRRVPIDIEQARQTPVPMSDAKLEATTEQLDRQQELQRQQAQTRPQEEPAMGGFAR